MPSARVLVVEDENIVALDIQSRLEDLGYDVPATASSGEEALEKAEAVRPDLVLMDITLRGEMDGIEASRRIRRDLNIPCVFLTAHGDNATLQRAKGAGPFGYIVKPFEERICGATLRSRSTSIRRSGNSSRASTGSRPSCRA